MEGEPGHSSPTQPSQPAGSSGRLERALGLIAKALPIAFALFALAGVVYVLATRERPGDELGLAEPDSPPLEYVYLDSDRVLAYLGQLEGGLSHTEIRTRAEKQADTASVAGGGGTLGVSAELSQSTQQEVTPTDADRFYRLLRALRAEQAPRPLQTVNLLLEGADDRDRREEREQFDVLRARFQRKIDVGDFVRLENAQLLLSKFAGVLPRARYAGHYVGEGKGMHQSGFREPKPEVSSPVSERRRRALGDYLEALGDNPRLPFFARTNTRALTAPQVITFFLPARYQSIGSEASLLSGKLTVVGKVVDKDMRIRGEHNSERNPLKPRYFDRQSLATYGPAFEGAKPPLLRQLDLDRSELAQQLKRSVKVDAPVVVVVPVAVYR